MDVGFLKTSVAAWVFPSLDQSWFASLFFVWSNHGIPDDQRGYLLHTRSYLKDDGVPRRRSKTH